MGHDLDATRAQQTGSVGIAATVLEKRISGSSVTWKDGKVETFQGFAIPPFFDTEIIDAVTRLTGQDASIYVFDKTTGAFLAKTTSITANARPISPWDRMICFLPSLPKERPTSATRPSLA